MLHFIMHISRTWLTASINCCYPASSESASPMPSGSTCMCQCHGLTNHQLVCKAVENTRRIHEILQFIVLLIVFKSKESISSLDNNLFFMHPIVFFLTVKVQSQVLDAIYHHAWYSILRCSAIETSMAYVYIVQLHCVFCQLYYKSCQFAWYGIAHGVW